MVSDYNKSIEIHREMREKKRFWEILDRWTKRTDGGRRMMANVHPYWFSFTKIVIELYTVTG